MLTKLSFEDNLYNLLLEKKYETILEFLKNPENEELIKSRVWNLINKICLTVKTNNILEHESDLVLCKKILLHIVDHGKPREVIVALMEEADSFKEHSFFCLLLEPLKKTLKKVPSKRVKTLEWVLSSLNAHIESLPPPNDYDLEGEEKMLLDATPEVVDSNYVLSNYYSFVEFFIDEVSSEKTKSSADRIEFQREILRKYILKLFHHPFLYLDLHVEDERKSKSTTHILCENYLKSLCRICRNVFDLYKYEQSSFPIKKIAAEEDCEEPVSLLAFSNLSYLIFVEKLAIDSQPFVYSHKYIFMNNLKYMKQLLHETNNCVLFKGLLLTRELLNSLESFEISYSCVEINLYTELSKLLLNVAVHCQVKHCRQIAINNFLTYIEKCDWKARYHLILQVVCTVEHSGCVGLAIDLYKNYLHTNMNDPTSYFLGKNLMLFMKKVFILLEGAETDLLENNDRIMSTLNFLRYLVLRDDRSKNFTGIWDIIDALSESYLKPLAEAINLSRAHYKETAKQAGKKQKTVVTVNNTLMPSAAWKEIYEKALLNFDVLESLLSRIREIIE
ncbi:glomulin [Parasteatoda tepidariorum]|uniref:glomulin n=1 Tax=Parasteatoda tepidariorum TaxID=114398 RepID=UPI001C7197D1|nr:glomulin [Parasteatoda tepidariorum]XP_042900810.1 glomulin [Parasteatoda tepidariorum]